jgi:D-lactate dehydrogenase (cytochrome)
MKTKTELDQFRDYLVDASNMPEGFAEKLFVPESEAEVAGVLAQAYADGIAVTISGARTGTVGGAVPRGGWILSLEKLNHLEIDKENSVIRAGAGTLLTEIQTQTDQQALFYPPDPTEWSCQIGGNVATDASGARSFKYGSTRRYVNALRVVLANGETVSLRRNEVCASNGVISFATEQGNTITAKVPTYLQPRVRKNASGFYSQPDIDAVDLFVGSEGLLGVVTEIELRVLPKPEAFLSGIVFFTETDDLLKFVDEIRHRSLDCQKNEDSTESIDASLIEYFDKNALEFIREKFPETPEGKAGAIFFEQSCDNASEDEVFEAWNEMLEKHSADIDDSWFAVDEGDKQKMLEFRHALPVNVNERIVRSGQRKIGTDMAVPDTEFRSFLRFYEQILGESGIENVTFGHIGDSHLHVNLLPKDESESKKARHVYGRCIAQAIMNGGTVSSEHGIGKLKSKYLYVMYGERYINEMAELKRAFDVKSILNRGNMFDEKFLVV